MSNDPLIERLKELQERRLTACADAAQLIAEAHCQAEARQVNEHTERRRVIRPSGYPAPAAPVQPSASS